MICKLIPHRVVEWFSDIIDYMRKPNSACTTCGTKMYRRPSQIESGNVFCSLKCSGLSQRITHSCPVCSDEYIGNKRTCSRKCANVARTGLTYTRQRTRDRARVGTLLKERVAHIRGGLCEQCGEANFSILQIHHKMQRSRGGTDNPRNLMLLCPNCHMKHHLGYSLFQRRKSGRVAGAKT